MRIIAIANQKGGVGKTSTAHALAVGLSRQGKRILAVDLDAQANLTLAFGMNPDAEGIANTYDVLYHNTPVADAVVQIQGVSLLCSHLDLSQAEATLLQRIGREKTLKRVLEPVAKDYDVCVVDCPPSLGLLSVNALSAAHSVLIPCQTEAYAIRAVSKLLETIDVVRENINGGLHLLGILATMYDGRKNVHKEGLAMLRNFYGANVYPEPIRLNVAITEASAAGVSVFDYRRTYGATDYDSMITETLRRIA